MARFKKGSIEAKRYMTKIRSKRGKGLKSSSSNQSSIRGVKKKIMAKRGRKKSSAKTKYKRSKAKNSTKINAMEDMLYPIGYGFGREKLSSVIASMASKLPFGTGYLGDELILGGASWLVNAKVKKPLAKRLSKNTLILESGRVGTTFGVYGVKKSILGN